MVTQTESRRVWIIQRTNSLTAGDTHRPENVTHVSGHVKQIYWSHFSHFSVVLGYASEELD